jgi:hypothetical protein
LKIGLKIKQNGKAIMRQSREVEAPKSSGESFEHLEPSLCHFRLINFTFKSACLCVRQRIKKIISY